MLNNKICKRCAKEYRAGRFEELNARPKPLDIWGSFCCSDKEYEANVKLVLSKHSCIFKFGVNEVPEFCPYFLEQTVNQDAK